jgi:glutamate-5-semialdehyde dehydrogenase
MDVAAHCKQLADRALAASRKLAATPGSVRTAALRAVAQALRDNGLAIKEANGRDLASAQAAGIAPAMLARLKLDDKAIASMAKAVDEISQQVDPVGQVIEGYVRPNGLRVQKVRVPLGVIFFIYESRPNVTSDAAALCVKSGNAVILRGGKEASHSNQLVAKLVRDALEKNGVPADAVQLVETPDRAAITELVRMEGKINLCIPRGGEALIRAVAAEARVPVIKHYTGNCHVFIDATADEKMAVDICLNGKVQKPGVCNAVETILIHKAAADRGVLKRVAAALIAKNVEIRGDESVREALPGAAKPATEADWFQEYLDLIVAMKVVGNLDEAIDHINRYGSQHTDAIVTGDLAAADRFVQEIDSAGVFVNCSTRFADGGEYGLGAEIGISTDKLHARGPMGAYDLTTYKWVVYGNGQVRN